MFAIPRRHRSGALARRVAFGVAIVAVGACHASVGRNNAPAAPAGVDPQALARLEARSRATASDAVDVYRHGVKVFDYHSRSKAEPLDLMSSTKSIVALAVGEAIAEGRIKSLDQPVYDFFPEWKQGRKQRVTLRHVLSMTTGLQNDGTGGEVYAAPDSVKQALAAELDTAPGAKFDYNNKAMALLAGVIHVATRQPLDLYVRDHFFTPMAITNWKWAKDDAGNPYAMAGLFLSADDFAKFGELVLHEGMWRGRRLAPAAFIAEMGRASQADEPRYGLLWWRTPTATTGSVTPARLAQLAAAGLDPKLLAKLQALSGRRFDSETEFHHALAQALPDWTKVLPVPNLIDSHGDDLVAWRYAGFDGVQTEGYLGQYLVVLPERGLVAVRQLKPFEAFDYNRNRFEDFADRVRDLVAAPAVSVRAAR